MAEFKLGRIRFVWKGEWTTSTTYYKDDVVRFGGKVYLCQIGHTASPNFNTDLDIVPTKWNLMADGQRWRDDWTTATVYEEGDLVKYGGTVYVCIDGHTSAATISLGLEANSADWNTFIEGLDWKNDWAPLTRYKNNDIVRYGGVNYICITGHTSASLFSTGLEVDIANWQVFSQGQEYLGTWTTAYRYRLNDIVKHGAGLWICTTQHTSSNFVSDSANWAQYVEGLEFENDWNSGTSYQPGDIVRYGGNNYVAKTLNTNANPVTQTSDWDLFAEGFNFLNDWTNTTSYKIGEVVRRNGYNYLAVTDSPSLSLTITQTNSTTDAFITSSTSGLVAGMTVRFTGTTFGGVFTGGRYYIKQILSGTEFTISTTSGGTKFEATADTGSMTATVSAEPPNSSYWTIISNGMYWRGDWADDVEYNLGDIVRYNSNTYICVQNHRSDSDDGSTLGTQGGGQTNSRPDLDSTGIYWNNFTVGSETSVLTTIGDLVYFGGAGPTRLPVGTEGQILRVGSSGTPEWVTWGETPHVYYVSTDGEDRPYPDCGGTLDKPWKTIRYACEQIEKGPRNPQAQHLLELNRAFIQKEITGWIRAQVLEFTTTNPDPASIWYNFDYDEYKCERDVGFIIDRLIWDLGHGGNLKIRAAAQSFVGAFGEEGEFSAVQENQTYLTLGNEYEQGVEAYTYLLDVVDAVLSNEAPATVYQNFANDSTAIVDQYINTDYTAEPGTYETVTSLVTIVLHALEDQDSTRIPERIVPNNTVNLRTGRYRETLPIIVPAETALVGDEKRSTNAGPAGSLVSKDDAKYSIGALGRLETVLGQIVLGTNVSESTGNIAVQDAEVPFASSVEAVSVQQLVRLMQHQIDYKIGTTNMVTLTDPTGYNTSFLSGFGDARKLLQENKEFIKDEITAWIGVNYSDVLYSRTKCRQDIGFIVDAVAYDLTYGGDFQTLVAGLAYFDGVSTTLLIDSTEIEATSAAYGRLKTVMQQIVANTTVTKSTGNTAIQWTDSTNLTGGSSAVAQIGALIDIIINIIAGDSTRSTTPQINVTQIATNDTFTSATHGLAVGDAVVPRTTTNGLTAGVKYWVVGTVNTNTFQLAATYGGSVLTSFTNGTGLDIDLEIIDYPTATDGVTSTAALITAAQTLDAAQETIVTNTTAFITSNFPTLTYNTAKCERDVRLILESVMFDFMFNSNYQTIVAALSYLRSSAVDVFNLNQKTATRAAFTYAKAQAQANVGGNATAQARIETLMTTLDDIVFGATNDGSVCATGIRGADYARLQIERNRDYIVAEIDAWIDTTYKATVSSISASTDLLTCDSTSWMQRNAAIRFSGTLLGNLTSTTTYYIQNVVSSTTFAIALERNSTTPVNFASNESGSMTVSLYYDSDACLRDVNTYLDAIKYDLQYTGNYRSRLAARYYANAVNGSLEEDMYYLRNGTGVRNQTLEGLTGDLLAPNAYGTSRVSAGAYCSLDPGWGPDDFRTWIIRRSPYVQNVATFGYAAIGQKIDGALHNGGNDSITSNDFTQIISDGIGAWVANNGRAELVSVFTYYAHIGYLSTEGGRIRGTNGNNSYGDFGSVAEGFDATETPILCEVDNLAFSTQVGSVATDGVDKLWQFEYTNAGLDYTEALWTVAGGGSGAVVVQDDFRDGAVFQVRLTDSVDDSAAAPEADGNFGGFGYISNSNTAQSGTTSSLTLAAVDDEITGAYVGMFLLVTSGTGAGQFGIVSSYTAGTKVAAVNKESTGTSGWDHLVPGTAIVAPDASSTYIVEPRISFTSPTYSSSARTLATAQTYVDAKYAETFAVYTPVNATGGSGSSATFTVVRKGVKYDDVVIRNAGTGYARLNTLTIPGTSLGGLSTANDITITVTAVNSTTGAITAIEYTGVGTGGNFVAVSSGSRTTNTSANGTTWAENLNSLPSTSNWVALAQGRLTVVESAGSFVTGRAYVITSLGNTVYTLIGASQNVVGTHFVATGAGTGSGTATPIANHLVCVSSSTTVNAYSTDGGATWNAGGALPGGLSGATVDVAYGTYNFNGRWVAIASNGSTAFSINGGVTWTAGGSLGAGTWSSVAAGQNRWVAITTGGTATAYSTDGGNTWTAGGALPASSTWISIAYGRNKFLAVSSDGTVDPAYSVNGGVNWSSADETGYFGTGTITSVRYGQGLFVVTTSTSNNARSSEDGINWTTRALTRSSGTGFLTMAVGNPNQSLIWAAIPSASTTAASSAVLGATAKGRSYVADNKIFAIRITDPGSAYSVAPTLTITDPNNLFEAPATVRIGNGVCANPSFTNRGLGYDSAIAELDTGNGYANNFQSGKFMAVRRLTGIPKAGANVVFDSQPNTVYKLVNVLSESGDFDGARSAFFQISPDMSVFNSPTDGTDITTRIRYSQVRLTGHDFLDIGTGNFDETNYPNGVPENPPNQANETVDNNGGRVFYTSTDQDGNFRVGELFTIEQSTGVATLNAEAFNIAGLAELSLGNLTLGGNSATITEFSTDPFLTANSDSVVSTQRAIKAYISAQIGGGGASLNVNSIVAGFIEIAGTRITTTTGGTIQMKANFNFQAGVRGYPLAWNYFLNN